MKRIPYLGVGVLLLLPLCSQIPLVSAIVDHGLAGLGFSTYDPTCCWACRYALSSLYLDCTIFSEDPAARLSTEPNQCMVISASTSAACYASNRPWLDSLAYCVSERCDAQGASPSRQAHCFQAVAADGIKVPSLLESMPKVAPSTELSADAIWLNRTSLVNPDLYFANYQTLKEFKRSEDRHTIYAFILFCMVIAICMVQGIFRLARSLLSTASLLPSVLARPLHSYINLPALFGHRHLEPLPFKIGYLPSRASSILIFIYIAANVIFSAVDFHSVWPNTWYLSERHQTAAYISNRLGVLSFANLTLTVFFSGRNNLLIMTTGWSQTTFLAFHRWSARMCAVLAITHSIIYTVYPLAPGYHQELRAPRATKGWGVSATVALSLAAGLAVLQFRLRLYELFLATHILFVILALIGCWYHVQPRSAEWDHEVWLYAAFALWAADRLARVVQLAWRNRLGASSAMVKLLPGSGFIHLKVYPRTPWNFAPGQHIFLYIPQLDRFWQSHPFTVATWSCGETDDIIPFLPSTEAPVAADEHPTESLCDMPHFTALIRVKAGMTSSLLRRIDAPGCTRTITTLVEGPYGAPSPQHHILRTADTVICIAGGIGITSCLGYVRQFVAEHPQPQRQRRRRLFRRAERMVLAWSVRERELLDYVREKLLPSAESGAGTSPDGEMGDLGLAMRFWWTGARDGSPGQEEEPEKPKRMDVREVVGSMVQRGKSTAVVVCAPGKLADAVRREVVKWARKGFDIDLVEEAFAW